MGCAPEQLLFSSVGAVRSILLSKVKSASFKGGNTTRRTLSHKAPPREKSQPAQITTVDAASEHGANDPSECWDARQRRRNVPLPSNQTAQKAPKCPSSSPHRTQFINPVLPLSNVQMPYRPPKTALASRSSSKNYLCPVFREPGRAPSPQRRERQSNQVAEMGATSEMANTEALSHCQKGGGKALNRPACLLFCVWRALPSVEAMELGRRILLSQVLPDCSMVRGLRLSQNSTSVPQLQKGVSELQEKASYLTHRVLQDDK